MPGDEEAQMFSSHSFVEALEYGITEHG